MMTQKPEEPELSWIVFAALSLHALRFVAAANKKHTWKVVTTKINDKNTRKE
jgi:hypothetical protein